MTQHLREDIRRKTITELSSWKKKVTTTVMDQKKWNYMVLVWKINILDSKKKKKSDLSLYIGRRSK